MSNYIFIAFVLVQLTHASDITDLVFGSVTDGMPAAFGDFNSDELTDVFMLRRDQKTMEILLGFEEEPLLRTRNLSCSFDNEVITSVVPGDFDGDAFMDVLVTTSDRPFGENTTARILWGYLDHLDCNKDGWTVQMYGQPLALDVNQDMIIDLFGMSQTNGKFSRTFWVFNNNRTMPKTYPLTNEAMTQTKLRVPHSHAFLDLNDDYTADLFITTEKDFEIWLGSEVEGKFIYNRTIQLPDEFKIVGQAMFVDMELIGRIDLIVPVCKSALCVDTSAIYVYTNEQWYDLGVHFVDTGNKRKYGFVPPSNNLYLDAITLRAGDFNMDGYPDIVATLQTTFSTGVFSSTTIKQAFFIENVACRASCGPFNRTYEVQWRSLTPFNNSTVLAAFYDFYQDGILDLIFVHQSTTANVQYQVTAFRNSLDYDANFIKVMVLTGLRNSRNVTVQGTLGKKKRTYGTNLPGPSIAYRTTTQEGVLQCGLASQLPQSAYHSLMLPYTIFGLGRTPNFVDALVVGLSNRSREWTQIIPNSQMVVIPWPPKDKSKWKAQLFVTPSKVILNSAAALVLVCVLIVMLIGFLHWKERREDKKEKLQESHRFHFDAM